MALFKNLYFDFGFLKSIGKKKKSKEEEKHKKIDLKENNYIEEIHKEMNVSTNSDIKELPELSKNLLSDQKKTEYPKRNLELPKIKKQPEPNKTNIQQKLSIPENFRSQDAETTKSFFNNLQSHIMKEETYIHSNIPKDVIYNNLFSEMKSFWDDHRYNVNKEVMDRAIKQDVSNKIEELQRMEIEWQKLQLQHEKIKDELASREIIIENKIKQLKNTFKKIHLNAHTHPDNHFVLSNGTKLRSLQELSDELLVMDEEVFNSHVNENKNDFANWVKDVMDLEELSKNMTFAKNKEQMANLIRNWHEGS